MTLPAHVVRRAWWRRALRAGLLAGALYDLLFAAAMVWAPQLPARLLTLPLPGESFYLHVLAVLLTIAAGSYLLAAWDPERYGALVGLAIGGRSLGALAFALSASGRPDLAGLWPLAGADAAFAAIHVATWRPVRG